jgi:hypothetical protein
VGSPFTAADWCGTVGWFPLYPLAMRLVGALGLGAPRAGLLLAELFALGSLGLVWWLLGASLRPATLACLTLAAVFPGSIYEHALFPVSLAVAAGLAFLGLAARRRWTAAGLAGAAAAAAYQPGVLLAAVAPLWLPLVRRRLGLDLLPALGRAVQISSLVVVGLLAVMGLQQAGTGRWDGLLLVEAKYGTGLHNPPDTFWRNATRQARPPDAPASSLVGQVAPPRPVPAGDGRRRCGRGRHPDRRRAHPPLDLAVLVYVALFWLAPLVAGGHLAQYRVHALLTPAVLALRRLPAVVIGVLAVLASMVAWRMAGLFYQYVLI